MESPDRPSPAPSAPIVAVIYAEVTAPVVAAQTPPLLAALRADGRPTDAVVFASPRRQISPAAWVSHRRALARLAAATGREPALLTHLPRDAGLGWMGRRMARVLERRGQTRATLLCRQPRAALVGIAARDDLARRHGPDGSPRVILDLRGVRGAEYLLTVGRPEAELSDAERSRLAVYREQEASACTQADGVLCVSHPMVEHVREIHDVPSERVARAVNHARAVADAERLRARARQELDLPFDAVVVAYAGTMAAWQMAEPSALLVRTLGTKVPGVRMLVVTPNRPAAREALGHVGIEDGIVKSATQDQVASLLCAADYGLLLREPNTVNRVACPVKFGEYLACGLRPILSPGIGDQTDAVRRHDLGVVVPTAGVDEAARRVAMDIRREDTLGADGRLRRRAWADEHTSPERTARDVVAFVDRVTALPPRQPGG